MGLTVIKNTNALKIVHSLYDPLPKKTLNVVHRKVEKPVIQFVAQY